MPFSWLQSTYRPYFILIFLVFFLNVYILYNTATQHQTKEATEAVRNVLKDEIEREKPAAIVNLCEITDALAKSAISRAKSESCKRKLEEAACRIEEGTFHDVFPESQCPNHDTQLIDLRIGCYSDSSTSRTLKEFEYKFPKSNSMSLCRRHCYKAGFLYYGLEFGQECFCGNGIQNSTKLADEDCQKYACPDNDKESCGGYNALDIYKTGLKKQVIPKKPKYIATIGDTNGKKAKILFLLQLNGRNVRQVKRFLKSIYLPNHYYYVHVDKRQDFMFSEMKETASKLPNMFVTSNRFSTIWGGASLLQMFQAVVQESMKIDAIKDWDYIVNFSESDFPVLPISDFESLINSNMGYSFLASHGYNTGRFIQKQGFEYVFMECDERMYRIGKRDFPGNLRIDGGSDWVGIHRDLAEYSISDEELPTKLRKLFESVLLPLESFYHTLSFNSKFCDDIMTSNLRLTNWYRKQGCRCAGLKKVVDWCGCSPLVFRNETRPKFEIEKAIAKPVYFSRKFDSMVDIDSIAAAEEQSVSKDRIPKDHPSFNSAFVNIYKMDIDGDAKHLSNLARSVLKLAGSLAEFELLERIDGFKRDADAPVQIVIKMMTTDGKIRQFLLNRLYHLDILSHDEVGGFFLTNATFGTRFEYKEEICREYMGVVTPGTTVQLKMEWIPAGDPAKNEKTSPEVEVQWKTSDDELIVTNKVKPYDSVWGGQFDEVDLKTKLKASPKTCQPFSANIYSTATPGHQIAKVLVPVYPENDQNCHNQLVSKFFEIAGSCEESCDETIWSTSYPDPKADIFEGFNEKLQMLI